LHEQDGVHTDGVVRIVVDDDTYVFGKRKGSMWKMVAVDRSGKYIVARYHQKEFNIANWLTANYGYDDYSLSDIKFCEQ